MTKSNRQDRDDLFRWADQIEPPLWDDLQARPAKEAASAINATLEEGIFKVPLLGSLYLVDPKERSILKSGQDGHRVSYQTGIVLLTTLAKSMGVPPSGRMVAPQELTGGTLFFTGAHTPATEPLANKFGKEPAALIKRAQDLKGEIVDRADFAVRIPALPLVPLYALLWPGDEEVKPRAFIGIDDRALFHLDLSGVFALTNIMVSRLVREI
jgi:hypothetical protein